MPNPNCIDHNVPSPETLAGIYICVEAEEEVLVAPRKPEQPNKLVRKTENGAKGPENKNGPAGGPER
jgi:hypothetical protein